MHLTSNTNFTEFDNYTNKGFIGTSTYDKNYLSSTTTQNNDYYLNNSTSYLLKHQDTYSSQKTVGQDSRSPYMNLLSSNGTSIVIICLIFKYKEHPILKIYSPMFCILIIIGMVIGINDVSYAFNIENVKLCKINYVIETLGTDMTLFPMVAVTYRIYKILTNKSKVSVDRNLNSRIVIFFIVGLSLMLMYSAFCAFHMLDFFLSSQGTIKTFRHPECDYSSNLNLLESIERRINELIYVFLVYMVVRTAKVSKKFGEFKYVYIMFIIGILEYARSYLESIIPQKTYYYYYMAVISFSIIMNGVLIYFLIGSRLIYVIKHPEEMKNKQNKYDDTSYYNTYNETQETTTNNDGLHSHFIDISKTGNTSFNPYINKHMHLTSNTNFTEFDNYTNKGFIGTSTYDKNYLSSTTTQNNDYYLNNSTSYLLKHQDTYSSQKTVGQDSRSPYMNLLSSNGTSSLTPNISIEDDYRKSKPK